MEKEIDQNVVLPFFSSLDRYFVSSGVSLHYFTEDVFIVEYNTHINLSHQMSTGAETHVGIYGV